MITFLKILKFLPPEIAHGLALNALNILYRTRLLRFFYVKPKASPKIFAGMTFQNMLGTAAGLDKNGDYIDCLGELGFGFLEVGTVTPEKQYGNAKPRVFRNFQENAIINKLGFNNKGIDHLLKNLKSKKYDGIVGVNVGANKWSSEKERVQDYLLCIEKVYKHSDYITVNISSPNTPNLRDFHNEKNIIGLVDAIDLKVSELNIQTPLFLKISPDESKESIDRIIEVVKKSKFTGIIATNTTIDKSSLSNSKLRNIEGGLSGEPLLKKSTDILRYIKNKSNNQIPVIGVGGVMDSQSFNEKIQAGSSLVQIYTGFVIKGPSIVSEILRN